MSGQWSVFVVLPLIMTQSVRINPLLDIVFKKSTFYYCLSNACYKQRFPAVLLIIMHFLKH